MPYSAGTEAQTGTLDVLSAHTGLTVQSIPLAYPGVKVALSGDGKTAYVLTRHGVNSPEQEVNAAALSTGQVIGPVKMSSPASEFLDIAVSPNGSKLFVASNCVNSPSCSSKQPGPCTIAFGVCIYNAATLAFESQVPGLVGMLSISLDGQSLYVSVNGRPALYVLNTQTLAVSATHMNTYAQGPPVVRPQGIAAVVFTKDSANILDTATNQFVGKFLTTYPGGSTAYSAAFGGPDMAAFAPDGKSLWVVLACYGLSNCTLPGGAVQALAGFEFPPGVLIAETPLPTLGSIDMVSLAFPQVMP